LVALITWKAGKDKVPADRSKEGKDELVQAWRALAVDKAEVERMGGMASAPAKAPAETQSKKRARPEPDSSDDEDSEHEDADSSDDELHNWHDDDESDGEEDEDEEEEETWEVEAIRKAKGKGKARKYLVKWAGFTEEANTWEPAAFLENNTVFHEWLKAGDTE
jgi:hypothetical protein